MRTFRRILERMERNEVKIQNNGFPVRIENKDVIISACKHFGYIPLFGEESFGWIDFTGIKNINQN